MMDFSATGDNSLVVRQSKNDGFGGLEKCPRQTYKTGQYGGGKYSARNLVATATTRKTGRTLR